MDSAEFWLPPGVKWCRLNRGSSTFLYRSALVSTSSVVDKICSGKFNLGAIGTCRSPTRDMMDTLAKEIGWTQYRVQKWFWRSRNHKKPSLLTKFKETSWRFLAYSCLVGCGMWGTVKEPFFWDQSLCFYGYPSTPPSNAVLSYWAFQLAFYSSLLVSQFSDIRRKDFYQMCVHHIVTIALLMFAYTVNMFQIGVLIALVHDFSDVPLELAKLLHYASYEGLAQASFVVFSIVFVLTRLIVYPFWLIWSAYIDIPLIGGLYPAFYMFITFLLILQVLHIYWFKLIMTMVFQLLRNKELTGDTRSDSELSDCTVSTTDHQSATNGANSKKTS
uniref:LAGL protein n=1 Tax=Suberites domuncula TaxID=55567 RepID=Q9GVA0_SUBDO|nr:LAGL protein [Suberites domuncula]